MAAVVAAVKASLAPEWSASASPVSAISSTAAGISGGIPSTPESLSTQAASLLQWRYSSGLVGQGWPACVVPSFVSTFAAPIPSSGSSCAFTGPGLVDLPLPTLSTGSFSQSTLPQLQLPFVVGLGYSPITAKLVSQIVAGKFVD